MDPSEVQRRQHELVNSRDLDGLREIMRSDVTYEVVPQGRTIKGVDEIIEWLAGEWFSAFSDLRIRIEEGTYLAGPGFSVAMVSGTGRHDGALGDIPATNRQVEFPAWEVVRVDGEGKVASATLLYDQLTLLTQLGQVPSPS